MARLASALLLVVALSGVGVLAGSAAAAAAPGSTSTAAHQLTHNHSRAKLTAHADHVKVHRGQRFHVKGQLALSEAQARTAGVHPMSHGAQRVIVQELRGGVWINIGVGFCAPDGHFVIGLRLNIFGHVTLRVFHPSSGEIDLAVYSGLFGILVL